MSGKSFEQGPIRPPSEAGSLLFRFTRNCPWNRCTFCPVYKGTQFSRRSLEEIKGDIDTAAEICRELRAFSSSLGCGGNITREVLESVFAGERFNDFLPADSPLALYGKRQRIHSGRQQLCAPRPCACRSDSASEAKDSRDLANHFLCPEQHARQNECCRTRRNPQGRARPDSHRHGERLGPGAEAGPKRG